MFAPIIAQLMGGTVAAAPTLTVTPGSGQNSLAWVDGPSASPITARKLYASTTSGTMVLVGTITSAAPYVDTSLTNGTPRFYRMSAVNSNGEGALSIEQSATPRAPLSVTGTPAAATQNAAYTFTPTASGGLGTKSFALTGTLPSGLSFSTATGAITGTPTIAATATGLNITVSDGNGSTPASLGAFSITVTAAATTSPSFGSSTAIWGNSAPTFGATS